MNTKGTGWNAGIPTAIMSCCPAPLKYALASGELEAEEREGDAIPFSSRHPRRTLRAVLVPISWDFEDGFDSVCAKRPESAERWGNRFPFPYFHTAAPSYG